jgi:hypothetical protein
LPPHDDARVHHLTGARDRVEEQLVAADLGDQEGAIGIVPLRRDRRSGVEVAAPQLAAGADDEMHDAVLRPGALVDVIVAGEHDADVVLDEDRLEDLLQVVAGAVPLPR